MLGLFSRVHICGDKRRMRLWITNDPVWEVRDQAKFHENFREKHPRVGRCVSNFSASQADFNKSPPLWGYLLCGQRASSILSRDFRFSGTKITFDIFISECIERFPNIPTRGIIITKILNRNLSQLNENIK